MVSGETVAKRSVSGFPERGLSKELTFHITRKTCGGPRAHHGWGRFKCNASGVLAHENVKPIEIPQHLRHGSRNLLWGGDMGVEWSGGCLSAAHSPEVSLLSTQQCLGERCPDGRPFHRRGASTPLTAYPTADLLTR